LTVVRVEAGVCGFVTDIEVQKRDKQHMDVRVLTKCDMIAAWAEELGVINWMENLKSMKHSFIFQCASSHIRHAACPVPVALLKAVEVEAGLALAADVTISFLEHP